MTMQTYYVHPTGMWTSSADNLVAMYLATEVDELLVEKSNDYGHEQAMRRDAERMAADMSVRIVDLERDGVTHAALLGEAHDRIEQLTRALQSCKAVIKAQRVAVSQFNRVASDALIEADAALGTTG